MGPFLIQPANIPPPTCPHMSLMPSAFLTSPSLYPLVDPRWVLPVALLKDAPRPRFS